MSREDTAPSPSHALPGSHKHIVLNRATLLFMLFVTVLKLWLVGAQDLLATNTPHDDYLFVQLAQHILEGKWLGPYNQMTLIKGPIYPLFLATVHHLGIPLLLAQQLLYALFCLLAVVAIAPLVGRRWLVCAIFFFLLLNPFTYLYPATGRVFRLGLSIPLVLALFSTLLGLSLRKTCRFPIQFLWSSLAGILFGLLWFTREEGLWLLPPVLLFAIFFLFRTGQNSGVQLIKRGVCLIWITCIFAGFSQLFMSLTEKHYGAPYVNELKSPQFQKAYGGLMGIRGEDSKRYIPVGSKSEEDGFRVSPTFQQLEPYFIEVAQGPKLPKAFYIWKLRDMVEKSGNGTSYPKALEFYDKMGEEIAEACSTGEIECIDRKPTIRPIWKLEYFTLVPETFWKILHQAVSFNFFTSDEYEYTRWLSSNKPDVLKDYQLVTRETLAPSTRAEMDTIPRYYLRIIIEKFRILTDVASGYKGSILWLFWLAVLLHLYLCLRDIRQGSLSFSVALGAIILCGILSLVSLLTYVKITLWGINRPLFSAYPLVLLYVAVIGSGVINLMRKQLPSPGAPQVSSKEGEPES